MKKITSLLITSVFLSLFSTVAFSDDNVKKLSNFQKTGTAAWYCNPSRH
jgi:hypothetical protein